MRNQFKWYPVSNESARVDDIWARAIFTFDANVLLDLYRYNVSTRDSIIAAIKDLQDQVWLSHQVAEEFFRNRVKVICSTRKSFRDAESILNSFSSAIADSVSRLTGVRLLEEKDVKMFQEACATALGTLRKAANSTENEFPNFLEKDDLLEEILSIFDGRVAQQQKQAELQLIHAEAAKRIKDQVPPGYLDENKDGTRPYGDYVLWSEILKKAQKDKKPIVLVTSERKEDWWERHSGLTVGPRLELIRELYEASGQSFTLYQTNRFLQISTERRARTADAKKKQEIYRVLEKAMRDIQSLESTLRKAVVESVAQEEIADGGSAQSGVLIVKTRRPCRNFTATGHFSVPFDQVPNTSCELVAMPDGMPNTKLSVGSGTTFDFNVHLVSQEQDKLLPAGSYTFKYRSQPQ